MGFKGGRMTEKQIVDLFESDPDLMDLDIITLPINIKDSEAKAEK